MMFHHNINNVKKKRGGFWQACWSVILMFTNFMAPFVFLQTTILHTQNFYRKKYLEFETYGPYSFKVWPERHLLWICTIHLNFWVKYWVYSINVLAIHFLRTLQVAEQVVFTQLKIRNNYLKTLSNLCINSNIMEKSRRTALP